jgi:hypothetical protein
MSEQFSRSDVERSTAVAQWYALLRDEAALLEHPGLHHKALLTRAYALHQSLLIDRDDLSDLLEQADGALAYAVEALFDHQSDN